MISGYGFIKRLNVDKEIFFHITQVQNGGDGGANEGGDNKDAKKVQIGDKVVFSIGQHDDIVNSFKDDPAAARKKIQDCIGKWD